MLKIDKFTFENKKLREQAFAIRHNVFVIGQNCPKHLEYENEESSTHFLLTFNGKAVATARHRKTKLGYVIYMFPKNCIPSKRDIFVTWLGSVFVMGMSKLKANLDVAMRENAASTEVSLRNHSFKNKTNIIQTEDNLYLIYIKDFKSKGDISPLSLEIPKIRNVLLNKKKNKLFGKIIT